jgi:transcriptional regulator with GAF, ATPase, and Fis domain
MPAEATACDDDFFVLQLNALSKKEESLIVNNILGYTPSKEELAVFHLKTGGNPFFTELLASHILYSDIDIKEIDTVPFGPQNIIASRLLKELNGGALEVCLLLSFAECPLSFEKLFIAGGFKDKAVTAEAIKKFMAGGYGIEHEGDYSIASVIGFAIREAASVKIGQKCHLKLFRLFLRDNNDSLSSWHSYKAGDFKNGAFYASRALARAYKSGDSKGVIRFLKILHETVPAADEREKFALDLIVQYRQTGDYTKGLDLFNRCRFKNSSLQMLAQLEKAAILRLKGDADEAFDIAQSFIGVRDSFVNKRAIAIAARIYQDKGDVDSAFLLIEGIKPHENEVYLNSGLLSACGYIYFSRGLLDIAQSYFKAGLDLSVKLGLPQHRARFSAYMGMIAHKKEHWEVAAEYYSDACAMADKAGDMHGAATYAVNLAAVFTESANIKDAILKYADGLSRLKIVGRMEELAHTRANYAQLLLRLGDVVWADRISLAAVSYFELEKTPSAFAVALMIRGDVLINTGKFSMAMEFLSRAAAIFKSIGQNTQMDICQLLICEAMIEQKLIDMACHHFFKLNVGAHKSRAYKLKFAMVNAQLGLLNRVDIESAFSLLSELTDMEYAKPSIEHVKVFALLALVSKHKGERIFGAEMAAKALEITKRLKAITPALHRPDVYPYESLMVKMVEEENTMTQILSEDKSGQSGNYSFKTEWLERIIRITARLNSELKLSEQLDLIMDAAIDLTGAERGFILLKSKSGGLKVKCVRNMDSDLLAHNEDYSRSVAERAFETSSPIVTTNAQEDPRFSSYGSVAALNLRYIIAIPLQVKGRTTGTVYIDSRRGGQFDDARLELLNVLADQAALALFNSQLVSENKRQMRQIKRLNKRLKKQLDEQQIALVNTRNELKKRMADLENGYVYSGIVAKSSSMKRIFRLIDRVAKTDIPLVIQGESGTGKELVARAIHQNGLRKGKPFVAENCAAIPASLFETILFGHVKGAFTGAVSNQKGLFLQADGGTLFLDEIGDMPKEMQSKLLRVLQENMVRPVGDSKSIAVDVRVIVASNINLKQLVKEAKFREDLFYRLHVMEILLPPLRERAEDIVLLADYFIKKHAAGRSVALVPESVNILQKCRWPGNVRQLENEIMRALALCDDFVLPEHFSDSVKETIPSAIVVSDDLNMERHINLLKKQIIEAALKKSAGNRTKAAGLLKVSRFGLQKMMDRLSIDVNHV